MSQSHGLQTDKGEPIIFEDARPFLLWPIIHPGDFDGQRHVNNAVYVKWMNEAAYWHSAALGYDWAKYQEMGTSFVVRRHEVDYLAPALPGDEIVIGTWPGKMEKFTAYRRHQIVRVNDGRTLARAVTQWVHVEIATGRPVRMSKELIDKFDPRI
jgi:acyl-CoA thioester hydrolase